MGACCSGNDRVQPRELDTIDKSSRASSANYQYFKRTNRTTTDIFFLLLLTTFLIVLLCLVGYCIYFGDIFRTVNGYDDCGNVCGRKHNKIYGYFKPGECVEESQTEKKLHLIERKVNNPIFNRKCVSVCPNEYRQFFNRCLPQKSEKVVNTFFSKTGLKSFFDEVSEDFNLYWKEFLYLCLISLGFSVVILILFRFLVAWVIWIVLIGVATFCVLGTAFLWYIWREAKRGNDILPKTTTVSDIDFRKTETYLVFAILATIITCVVLLVIIVMRKRIQLVVQLFKESGKALSSMPSLLFNPLVTFACLVVVLGMCIYFSLWIESSGKIAQKSPHIYYYKKDILIKVTRWYNIFALLWLSQFMIACQHMVIAGAVSIWYFTRDKSRLDTPVLESAYNLSRYHLGSVALGSFVIALVQFARVILKFLERYLKGHKGKCVSCTLKCCQCCLYCFEKILKYLSRNAYIEVAMHGHSFCKGGRQAFSLLSANIIRVAAINSVGDFVLFLGKVLVVMATVLIGIEMLKNKEGLQHMWVLVTLAGLFAYFVSHCFMTVYEMAIDTIFLCFCEDCEQNDGVNKPFFMSRDLMEFVENSKKSLKVK